MNNFNFRKFNGLVAMFDSKQREQAFKKACEMLDSHNMSWTHVMHLRDNQPFSYEEDDFIEEKIPSQKSNLGDALNDAYKFGQRIFNKVTTKDNIKDSVQDYEPTVEKNMFQAIINNYTLKSISHNSMVVVASLNIQNQTLNDVYFTDFDDIIFFQANSRPKNIMVKLKKPKQYGEMTMGRIINI